MRWMHRVRLYPKSAQVERLRLMLNVTRDLYNAALQERRDAYRMRGISVSAKMQYAELTALRGEMPRVAAVFRECEDAVLHRLDLAMQAFFRRVKRGETPGFPRFRSFHRWSQLEFPHGDRALKLNVTQTKVRIPGVGSMALRKGREVPTYGRAFVVEKNERWYAVFECGREAAPLPASGKTIGVDRGVHVLAATSDGMLIRNGAHNARLKRVVAGHARALDAATKKDASGHCLNRRDPKRKAAALRLARAKEREANARLDGLHKAARLIVTIADVIGIEALSLRKMTRSAKGTLEKPGRNVAAKSGLNRVLLDAGFGRLATLIREKAEYAARKVIDVDPRYSSQTCGRCLHVSAKSRRKRRFICIACGFVLHADVNAALEIRRRAQLALMSTLTSGENPGSRCVDAA